MKFNSIYMHETVGSEYLKANYSLQTFLSFYFRGRALEVVSFIFRMLVLYSNVVKINKPSLILNPSE